MSEVCGLRSEVCEDPPPPLDKIHLKVFLAGFPMNLIGLPAEGGKCGSLLPDGVGARGLYTRIWDSR